VDLDRISVVSFDQVAILGDRLVTIGQRRPEGSLLFASRGGAAWQLVDTLPSQLVLETVLVMDGRFWLVGHRGPTVNPSRQVWTSGNGTAWQRTKGVTGLDFGPGRVARIVRVEDTWLATAWSDAEHFGLPLLFGSTDGLRWKPLPIPVGDPRGLIDGLTASGDQFVALERDEDDRGPVPRVVRSRDGVAWEASRVSDLPADLRAIVWGEDGYVAYGSMGTDGPGRVPVAFHSADAISWERALFAGEPSGGSDAMLDVIPLRGQYVGSGYVDDETLAAWISADGRTWFPAPDFPPKYGWITDVTADGNIVVMTGQNENGEPVVPQVWLGELQPPGQ
jgi:hypothetical protein